MRQFYAFRPVQELYSALYTKPYPAYLIVPKNNETIGDRLAQNGQKQISPMSRHSDRFQMDPFYFPFSGNFPIGTAYLVSESICFGPFKPNECEHPMSFGLGPEILVLVKNKVFGRPSTCTITDGHSTVQGISVGGLVENGLSYF